MPYSINIINNNDHVWSFTSEMSREEPPGRNGCTAASKLVGSNSGPVIAFTFGLMPLGKVLNPLIPLYGLNSIIIALQQEWHWH